MVLFVLTFSLCFAVLGEEDSFMWSQTYGGTERDEAYSVVETSDGGYAIAGYTYSLFPSGPGGYDCWLV